MQTDVMDWVKKELFYILTDFSCFIVCFQEIEEEEEEEERKAEEHLLFIQRREEKKLAIQAALKTGSYWKQAHVQVFQNRFSLETDSCTGMYRCGVFCIRNATLFLPCIRRGDRSTRPVGENGWGPGV